MKILSIKNLKKSYGKHKVLDDLDLEISVPDIYALVGPNGSGKTTLFSTIANIIQKNSGEISVFGIPNTDKNIFKKMSYLKDNSILYGFLTGKDHLKFLAGIHKIDDAKVKDVINLMGIGSYIGKKVGEYSLGMKQHLIIAMNILTNPKLMILDEPLNGLDPTSVIKVRNILKKLSLSGVTILLSSHTLSEIDLLTKNIFFIKNGKIIEDNLSKYQNQVYYFDICQETIGRIDKFEGQYSYDKTNNKLKFFDTRENISEFIRELLKLGINFSKIEKVDLGAEKRYMEIYPEEIERIRLFIEEKV